MVKNKLMTTVSGAFYKVEFKCKKYSPEILLGVGIVGTVAATVMACVATLKLDEKLQEPKDKIDTLKENVEAAGFSDNYTEQDYRRELSLNYAKGGLEIIKLYAPSFAVGTLSITAILAGHNVIKKRNVALAAAYTALDSSFTDYRNRVITRFGENLDRELRYDIRTEEVEETVKNEDGTESVVKKNIEVVNNNEPSVYSRFFDRTCNGWKKDAEYNRNYIEQQRKYLYEILKLKGHLFLNEFYAALGMRCDRMGEVMGWIYDPNQGDEQIDLGIYNKVNVRFVNGYESVALLDPNVTYIYNDFTKTGGLESKYSGNPYRDVVDHPELFE